VSVRKGKGPHIVDRASLAVDKLRLGDFIRDNAAMIRPKIESADAVVTGSPYDNDAIFLAKTLPIANGVIHIGSDRVALKEAMAWLRSQWKDPQPDAMTVLSALTLIHIAVQAKREYEGTNDAEKLATWSRIVQRVTNLMQPKPVVLPTPTPTPPPASP
jgi:hypothetical protein